MGRREAPRNTGATVALSSDRGGDTNRRRKGVEGSPSPPSMPQSLPVHCGFLFRMGCMFRRGALRPGPARLHSSPPLPRDSWTSESVSRGGPTAPTCVRSGCGDHPPPTHPVGSHPPGCPSHTHTLSCRALAPLHGPGGALVCSEGSANLGGGGGRGRSRGRDRSRPGPRPTRRRGGLVVPFPYLIICPPDPSHRLGFFHRCVFEFRCFGCSLPQGVRGGGGGPSLGGSGVSVGSAGDPSHFHSLFPLIFADCRGCEDHSGGPTGPESQESRPSSPFHINNARQDSSLGPSDPCFLAPISRRGRFAFLPSPQFVSSMLENLIRFCRMFSWFFAPWPIGHFRFLFRFLRFSAVGIRRKPY